MLRIFLVALILMSPVAPNAPAKADGLDWTVGNSTGGRLWIRFFSQWRDHVWPGGRDFYYVDPGQQSTVRMTCQTGEKICFGAINNNRSLYWGVGEFGRKGCQSCCRTCGEFYSNVTNLN